MISGLSLNRMSVSVEDEDGEVNVWQSSDTDYVHAA